MREDELKHIYVFVSGVAIVSQKHAFSAVLERLRDAGIEVVEFDEILRRIVLRSPKNLVPVLENYAKSYFTEFSFEIKGTIKNRSILRGLRRLSRAQTMRVGERLVGLYSCGEASVWFELARWKALVKYCRKSLYSDPASFPQSLCAYTLNEASPIVETVDKALNCFKNLIKDSMQASS
jgi:hypothetical protein